MPYHFGEMAHSDAIDCCAHTENLQYRRGRRLLPGRSVSARLSETDHEAPLKVPCCFWHGAALGRMLRASLTLQPARGRAPHAHIGAETASPTPSQARRLETSSYARARWMVRPLGMKHGCWQLEKSVQRVCYTDVSRLCPVLRRVRQHGTA